MPRSDTSTRGATLTYRFESESPPVVRLKLKIEINTREHLCLLPIRQTGFSVESRWFKGAAELPLYSTSELLGTKVRALYQCRKGRDLFDLWRAHEFGMFDSPAVAGIFMRYMEAENHTVSAEEFARNLKAKMSHPAFLSDTPPLLRPGVEYDPRVAYTWLIEDFFPHIP